MQFNEVFHYHVVNDATEHESYNLTLNENNAIRVCDQP